MRNTRPVSWLKAGRKGFEDFPGDVESDMLDALTVAAQRWAESTFKTPLSSPSEANGPTLGQIITIAQSRNFPPSFQVALPQEPAGVYTVSTFPDTFPDDPAKRHVLHIDRYSGAILADIKWTARSAKPPNMASPSIPVTSLV